MSVAEMGMQKWHITYSENLNAILGCVRLGNPDLDFEIRISDFAIERENRKQKTDFTDFTDFTSEKSVLRVDFN